MSGMDNCFNYCYPCSIYNLHFMGKATLKAYIPMQDLLKRIYGQLEKTSFCYTFR